LTKNDLFLQALKEMNATMKQDIKDGNLWKYCNVTKKKEKTFFMARKNKKFLVNCVDGVSGRAKSQEYRPPLLPGTGRKAGRSHGAAQMRNQTPEDTLN
jgi:hypothetical protein